MPAASRKTENKVTRDARIIVRCTAAERRRAERDADKAGMKFSPYVRARIFDGKGVPVADPSPRPAQVHSRDLLIKELSAIGNNLNQIARAANATGELKRAAQLDELVAMLMAKVPAIR